ncbi:SagB/ThcOx family dehydrogenase [Anaerocolumna xylanovorans]|uniref:SagB-type dehydrogenase domain-containing protein n=1 Tax=Anaerocolumna xylanovorans DSM 12503 TaxID=1121345 RepID=A0A1M7XX39_9FIRM|nr:SagB/ThcOx family dehydrogenase [Anaerocolumna xylanovorans]SHO43448.1 SagB-type dehydrogenase domain-containing protein [Anaerocolumna xylanovorans DSM 12503]
MDNNYKQKIIQGREIMKASDYEVESDEKKGLPQPSLSNEKSADTVVKLSKEFEDILTENSFLDILNNRGSKRKYTTEALTLKELSFLLWATQGVKGVIGNNRKATLRTVPSAGARHPFETYLFVNRVEGLIQGMYHYLPLTHELELIREDSEQENKVTKAFLGQSFAGGAPVSFVWSVVPYRSEWRYTVDAQKYALIDAGHICQNLYLAGEAIGCGVCAIGAYDQQLTDSLIGLSKAYSLEEDSEFTVYAAAVGKKVKEN